MEQNSATIFENNKSKVKTAIYTRVSKTDEYQQ